MAASSKALTLALGYTVGAGDRTVLIRPEGGSVAISTRRGGKTLIPLNELDEVIRCLRLLAGATEGAGAVRR